LAYVFNVDTNDLYRLTGTSQVTSSSKLNKFTLYNFKYNLVHFSQSRRTYNKLEGTWATLLGLRWNSIYSIVMIWNTAYEQLPNNPIRVNTNGEIEHH